jgi:hypothetical protein
VAGFTYEFSYTDLQRPYVTASERIGKARARTLSCRWRTSHDDNLLVAYHAIDGPTRRLDLLARVLELDLPMICQGVDGELPPARAYALGMGIADLFLVGRDLERGEGRQVLRPRKATSLYHPVYEIASDAASAPMLGARLRISETVLADYALGRVDDSVALEELHTAAEKVMRVLVPSSDRLPWPKLRQECLHRGLLPDPDHFADALTDSAAPGLHAHTPEEVLAKLNEERNPAKHNPNSAVSHWLRDHWECVAYLIEKLTGHVA